MKDSKIELIRRFPGLTSESERALAKLAALVDEAHVEEGKEFITEGTQGREMFLIVEGVAEVAVGGRPVAEVGPGEIVGEMAMLDGGPRTATVRARTALHVLVIGPHAFQSFANVPAAARMMAKATARRLRDLYTQ